MTRGSTVDVRLLPCGDRALLVEVADSAHVVGLYAALRAAPPPGVVDMVPAARTLLLRLGPDETDLRAVAEAVRRAEPLWDQRASAHRVEVPVRYDGEDLAEVARLTGLTEREVVAAHTGSEWTVAFCGFAPGFGYLTGGDPRLRVPRRAVPRTRVPAGSVGLAGEYSGVYPRVSPGGWQLIGRTDLVVWQVDRDPPALLRPGATVRFVEVS
ncbi:5-oxoprolinase subunit PxpB [Streptoalloteichus hindustanus]|uniref:Sensor histidine kinase inhibitor, KipI family n=1 Tax=Streptoalloteichus hindustanus TaxID=2017 RepID=A0A1M5B2K0_STRHI|nr:5-oxoprolinase subunit PxpB [Streptoalloteichus hindustanus]SHF36557.1 sensor histidine kinase inhibitor, KipI family [Streptoalloteichus hindustanus]